MSNEETKKKWRAFFRQENGAKSWGKEVYEPDDEQAICGYCGDPVEDGQDFCSDACRMANDTVMGAGDIGEQIKQVADFFNRAYYLRHVMNGGKP